MKVFESTMATDGTITVPAEICSALGLKPHDQVRFEVDGAVIRVRPVQSRIARHFASVVTVNPRSRSIEEDRAAFEEGVAADVMERPA